MTSACAYLRTILYMKIEVYLSVQHGTNLNRTVICGLGLAYHIARVFPLLEAHAIDIMDL